MSNEHNHTVRDTLRGAVGGAGLFGAVAVIQALRAGMGIGQVTQPILVRIIHKAPQRNRRRRSR